MGRFHHAVAQPSLWQVTEHLGVVLGAHAGSHDGVGASAGWMLGVVERNDEMWVHWWSETPVG